MTLSPVHPPEGTVRDWLDRRAERAGDTVSHVFPGAGQLSWAGLRDRAADIAARLAALGLARGESVALLMPNGLDAVTCLFGVLYGGFRATVLNLAAGPRALGFALADSTACLALVAVSERPLFDAACAAGPAGVVPIAVSGGVGWPPGTGRAPLDELSAGDDALLMYTSGTTGRPKGVVHSHASLLAGGWTTALAHALGPEDRAHCILPTCHINGLCVTLMGPLVSGGSVIVSERFSAGSFWDVTADHGATWFSAVPTVISHLVHGPGAPDPATVARLRFARSASSALAPEVQRGFEDRFGIPIVETMGLTETAAQILSNPLPPGRRKTGSPGRAVGCEVAILGPDLSVVGAGTEGEIAVRGPNVMRGYFRNPQATAEAFGPDGWLLTGDLGRMDGEGYVFVTGRRKELIIKGGENIAPREIDEALYAHPDVVEAAAFGVQCPIYGETVHAAVALRRGASATEAELVDICVARLGRFKAPERIAVLDALPKGPSGKIQRLKIRDVLAETP
jgi:acyl-CoA synthetase (AMP-forming)/AMP-acid ligase II